MVATLALSVLYFALILLLLTDSSRELAAARRFRSRVVAASLAENAAELAAQNIVNRAAHRVKASIDEGDMTAEMRKSADGTFQIEASARTAGLTQQSATVRVYGRVEGTAVRIDYTIHSQ